MALDHSSRTRAALICVPSEPTSVLDFVAETVTMSPQPTAREARRMFLDFFTERGHREVPSSPVFPQDDPTLLFTNAGMNQFKDVFLGTGSRDYRRAVDTQKCIRVSGKHNDLEEVGVDTYHHTFFEMLGNWSFGDYFKRDAIEWAWELLTGVYKLPKERLWVSVFGGDEKDGLAPDVEAEELWREVTDISPDRILRFGKEDNFWEMGDTGPCGPCSEIHIDRGGPGSNPADGADPAIGVNAGNERFIELWNLVFMQFNRLDDGSLRELPAKSVDTGMGFERILSVLQGKLSNYDTDLFTPYFTALERRVGHPYGGTDGEKDIAYRVIADHVRAVSAAFADGALPGNVGRGYVLRRLIRRAARFGRQSLGIEDPFLHDLVGTVGETLGDAFPELVARREHVELLVRSEEEAFGATLGRGLTRFSDLAGKVESAGRKSIGGEEAYELYATYGFPRDLVELMARERGLQVESEGWDTAQAAHQAASRSDGKFAQLLSAEQLEGLPETVSTYHDDPAKLEERTTILKHVAGDDGEVRVVLEKSPFYPESGGQVGDRGHLLASDGSFRVEVSDTQKLGSVVVHIGKAEGSVTEGAEVDAQVDANSRASTRRHHTATHLLHRALRLELGDHVTQQGSYVGPDRLRFDVSHPRGISAEELASIEHAVNAQITANAAVTTTVEDLEAAKERGVTALFGEKYDDRVRVVDVDGWSTELCGGTHVGRAGDIGAFVILSERAVQAGVRRIEAVAGSAAIEQIQHQRRSLEAAAQALKVSTEDVPDRIAQLQTQLKEAKKKAQASKSDTAGVIGKIREGASERSGVLVGALDLPELDRASLREVGGQAKALSSDYALCLFGREGSGVPFLFLSGGKAIEAGLGAGELAKLAKQSLGGGGGGRPDSAQGQGQQADELPTLLTQLRERFEAAL